MSGRRSKKNQRIGSSRRGPKGLNRNIEEDDGFQQIPESGDGKTSQMSENEFHTLTDYHSAQFDLPPSSSIDQQTCVLECPPHARSQKDSLMETELPERKRKMGSTRKSAGGFKVERKLEVRTTEDLDEYVTQSASEEQNPSLTEDEQSSSSSFSSNLSLQAESSGLGGEPRGSVMVVVSENEEEDAIRHQEITSHSYEVVSDTPIDKAMGVSVYSAAATVAESDLLQDDSVMFNELKTLSRQETPSACTSGQKRKMGSTRRPLGGKNSENVGLQEHSRSMTENERKAEVIDEVKFSMSEEVVQMWDDVARDDPSSYTESSLVSKQSLLAKRAEVNKPDVSAGTETMNQSVVFPLVDPQKSLPETSSHHGTLLLNKGLDFKFGSNTEDFDVPNKVPEEAGSNLSDDNQHVPDTRNYTNTSHNCRDVNTVEGEEVLKQKEEPSANNKMSSLSPGQDAQLEELVLNSEKSPSLSQNNNFDHTAQLIDGGNSSFDVPASNISNAKLTTTNSPHEMSDAVEQSQEVYVEMKHENNVSDVASMTCDSLKCDERGPVQGDAIDHIVTQIVMEVRNIKEDEGESTETIWISNQKPCEDLTAKEALHREQDYSSTISRAQSGPPQDNAVKMLENKEVREDKEETGTTVINDVTSKSEEMLSFEDSATETGSHENQQLFMQSHDKYVLSESGYEEIEKQVTFFSAESENAAFDKSVGRSEETEGIEGMDAAGLILELKKPLTNVCTVLNDSKSDLQVENTEQNKILTEEQNDASPDINLEAFQISEKICTEIDSCVILQVAVSSEETDSVNKESDISPVIPEDSQDSYKKITTFHSETQENEGHTDILPVGGDTDLEIQTQNEPFYSSTSEAVRTEDEVREFQVNGETVTVKSNRNTKSYFIQTSSEALKVSENPENEVSSEINIILEDTHREEVCTQSSPVVYKRKMGSTRMPFKGNKGQRKGMNYHDEDETPDSEATMNVEKETFSLEDDPSPDKSTSQSSKDGAKEQEMEICEKDDVGSVEGSESALEQSSFSLDSVSEESTAVTISYITESQTLTEMYEESQENTGDAERGTAEGGTESHSEIRTEIQPTDLTTSEEKIIEDSIHHATVLVEEVEFIVDSVTVESNLTESDLLQNDTVTVENIETFKVSENIENVSFVTDTGHLVQGDATEGSGQTNTIPDKSDTNSIPEDTHREEAHSKSSPIVHKRKMGSTRRPLKGNAGQRKEKKYHDENETLDSESMINVEKEIFSLEDEPSPDKSTSQSSKDGAKEQEMEICEKNVVGSVEGSESALEQSSFSLDSVSEESTAVTISHITESQTLTEINVESQENTGDAERGTAEGSTESHSEIRTEIKPTDLTTLAAERTEENISEATVLVEEVEFIVDTVTVEGNMTESDLLQNDTVTLANLETLKVSENIEDVSFVSDTGLLVQDHLTEASGETNTIPDQSDTNTIPEDTHREEAHSKLSPIVHKREMGSTRRPLEGNAGQRNGMKYHDVNETLDSEATMNVEKEIFSLEDEPSPDKSTSQSSKDGAKEQEMEICEKNDVGSVEGSESALEQSSFGLDLVSEESTAVTISHITESQTLTEINVESQENTGDSDRGPAEGGTESHSEIKPTDLTTSGAERTEENILEATVLVEEVEFIGDTVTVEGNKSDLLQNDTVTVVNMETFKVSENIENVSSVTDTGLLVQGDATEGSGQTNTIPDQSDTNTIPEDTHKEEAHSKSSPIVHKRKMGSTRRPLKGNKGQRKGMKYHDEDETLDSEATMNVEKETLSLEDEPSPDKSTSQSSKDGAKEQEMEICEKNDVGSVEGSESALEQSSFILDSVSEESTAVTISHITESQTLTEMNEESQENTGDSDRGPAEGGTESQSEIKLTDLTTSVEERTEENISEATVLVEEVEFIVDSVTVEGNMTESVLLQNDTVTVAKLETLKSSENIENVSFVTDTGLLVQDDATEASGQTNTIPDKSDTNTIPEDTHREEAHSKSSPIVYKRKMGSTRRPLKGNAGQRKGMKYHDENETLDSEATINVEKETLSLEDEPSPDKSTSQSSKDGAKEQEMEICEKDDVGSVEGSESALEQSSFSLDSVSEESTAVTISHITESQTLTEMNEESQENTGDAERGPAEGGTESDSEIRTEIKPTDLTTSAEERTEDCIRHATVLVEEVEFIVDSVTVEGNMTESDLLQNDTVTVENLKTLKVSENIENVSFVTDTGLLVQDDATEGSEETNTIPDQSDTNTITEDTHREEAHSKSSPIVHKRKMGSTRRPLKGNKGQRKGMKYHDEDETLDSEAAMNVEKETLSLEDEPCPDKSTSQSSKDGAKEQEMEICEKNDVGSVEGSESALIQSSFGLDSVSEESTAVTISHITESQTLTEINVESQENTGDSDRGPAEGGTESHSEIKPTDLTTSAAERTEENISETTVLVEEVEFIVDSVTVEGNMTESDLLQNDTVTVENLETLKVSENIENVSFVTDTGLLMQGDATEGSGQTNTFSDQSDTNTIHEETHREEAHSKSSPIVHKRKMGSTRRPLRGDAGQRKRREYHDENETITSESMFNVEKETFSLENEPGQDKSTSQSSKDGAKEQEMEICEKNDVGSVEGSESALEQSSFSLDLVSEESTAVTISHITESQTLTEMNEESQENTGDNERGTAEGGTESHSEIRTEIKPTDLTTSEAERTEDSIHHATVLVEEVEFIVDSVTVEGDMTESALLQNDTVTLANLETLKVSENIENVSFVSDTGLLVQDDATEASGQTNTIPDQSDTNTINEDTHREEAHSKSKPIVHKRKMGSTRRPLKGNKGQRKGMKYHDEDETLDSEATMNVEKETLSLEDEPSPDKSTFQSSKDGAKEQEMEICEKNDVGSVEGSESDLIQSSFGLDSVSEESTAVTISHITESQTLTEMNIQDVASKSDVQTENSEQNNQNQAAEIVLDLPLGDVETYSFPEQSKITSILPEEFHRKDTLSSSSSIPYVQKRKMGSTRKTLRGNKGQRGEVESKTMDAECKGMEKELDTDPHLAIIKGENKCKLDEQNFPVEFSHQASISKMFSELEDGVKEVSLNIHDSSEVSEEKGMENTVNDSNSLTEAINLYGGTMDKFDLTVSCEDIHQTMSADYYDQHVHGGSEPEQTETICHVFPTQVLKNIQDDVVHENSSQKLLSTQEKRRKIGSTRKNPRVMHGENMGDQYDILGMAMDRGAKKAENDLGDMPLASNMSQPKEMSPEAVSAIDIESEMLVNDLKGGENDYQNSDQTTTTAHETPENTEDQLVSVDVTKHLQPKTVPVEKRRKMGSTRKNVREGRIRGKRDVYEDVETAETHPQMSQDSEMGNDSEVGKAVGEQTIHNYSDQSEDSLLSEIERALYKTSQSSSIYELIVKEPNSDDSVNTSHLNKPENSEIKSLQPKPSQSSETHSEPNSPERRRRKMGSTRKNPRQQIKAEREDEDKEDGEIEGNLEANNQEMKHLEIVATSVVHNIPENKLNKEYLDVPSAHTSSSQLEESSNPIVQERTSPSTKRKFGSRRTNKGKQGLGRLDASDSKSELGDEVDDNLRNDLPICDTHLSLQPENQPIFQPISEPSNVAARNEEAATKGTGAGIVCLDQIIKHDRSTGTRQTIHLKNRNSELPFNVVMVGNSCVGKTSFIRRIHEGQFTQDYRSTIGIDTCMQTVELPDRTVKLQIWDTAGQERFHSITTQVFHKADGLLFMYEITCSKSFISVRDWISQARERAPDDAIMILLGNKNDSVERKVQIQEGADLAREYKIHFMECSAATGDNASESLRTLAELLVERKKRKEEHTALRREPPPKKSGCC